MTVVIHCTALINQAILFHFLITESSFLSDLGASSEKNKSHLRVETR